MSYLDTIEKFSTIIVAVVNVILVLFVFLQIRDSRKPFVTTGIISSDKIRKVESSIDSDENYCFTVKENRTFWDDIRVEETGPLAMFIRNDSKNVVKQLDLNFSFNFDNQIVEYEEKRLSHLNPKEATYLFIKHERLIEKFPEYFTEYTAYDSSDPEQEHEVTIKFPKKIIRINLKVFITYNPIFLDLLPTSSEDNYSILWAPFEDEELFSRSASDLLALPPRIMCWNHRDPYYIHKMQR
ncbi:MAG: hypothetical protein M0Q91_17720 [Methanoregula sp.]|jgi:hypothetical protein|nr:hypothetical protein [Methanoregula sp.]